MPGGGRRRGELFCLREESKQEITRGRCSLPARHKRNSLWDCQRGEFRLQERDFSLAALLAAEAYSRAMVEIRAPHLSCTRRRPGTCLPWQWLCQRGFRHHPGQHKRPLVGCRPPCTSCIKRTGRVAPLLQLQRGSEEPGTSPACHTSWKNCPTRTGSARRALPGCFPLQGPWDGAGRQRAAASTALGLLHTDRIANAIK